MQKWIPGPPKSGAHVDQKLCYVDFDKGFEFVHLENIGNQSFVQMNEFDKLTQKSALTIYSKVIFPNLGD